MKCRLLAVVAALSVATAAEAQRTHDEKGLPIISYLIDDGTPCGDKMKPLTIPSRVEAIPFLSVVDRWRIDPLPRVDVPELPYASADPWPRPVFHVDSSRTRWPAYVALGAAAGFVVWGLHDRDDRSMPVSVVPEPSALALALIGCVVLLMLFRMRE